MIHYEGRVKKLLGQLQNDEISFGRFVEILNEDASKAITNTPVNGKEKIRNFCQWYGKKYSVRDLEYCTEFFINEYLSENNIPSPPSNEVIVRECRCLEPVKMIDANNNLRCGWCNKLIAGIQPASPALPADSEIDTLAKEKGIVCWLIPSSYQDGRVAWSYEIEVLPYTEMGEYLHKTRTDNGADAKNFFYSYQDWDSYDEAKKNVIDRANNLLNEFMRSKPNSNQ